MEPSLQETTVVEYTGDRSEQGQFHGHGRAVFTSGQVYEGEWHLGHMHGAGRLSFPDGVSYEGCLQSDNISGRGVYQWGNIIYEGDLLDGLRHGYGTMTFTDSPVVYEGEWQMGKRHGRGVLYYDEDRATYYEGEWEDDMKHGQGTSMYPSGNSYSGSWFQDQRHGTGTMQWLTKWQVYSGQWANNLPNGLGEHVWQQGMPSLQVSNHAMHVMYNRYFGMFKDGKRHGEGALCYSSGARYEGQWRHDRKQGQGVYMFEDGSVFAGQFAADRPLLDAGTMTGAADTFNATTAGYGAPGTLSSGDQSTPSSARRTVSASPAAATADPSAECEHSPSGDAAGSSGVGAGAGAEAASAGTGLVANGPPGFGPRISALQLYIADLLEECDTPAVTYKAVSNLLVGFNTELRALYDKYCNRMSPLIDPKAPRNSWALQLGQLWELLRDSQLLCRHVQLQHACQLVQCALSPPPPVEQHRQQVLATPDAAAVLQQPQQPYDPTMELLYRDFCELLVRLAAVRYPHLPCLEQQLQQVIVQHLLPLVGGPTRQGGARQSLTSKGSLVNLGMTAVGAGGSVVGPEQLQQEDLLLYLQAQAGLLQQLYAVFASVECTPTKHLACAAELDQQQQQQQHLADGSELQTVAQAPVLWREQAVTVRQVVQVLQRAGVLEQWQLGAAAVAAALLEGSLGIADPEGLRARIPMEEANMEPPEGDQQQQSSSQAAAEAAVQQELTYWMDAPLLLPELLWGIVRCAAMLPQQLTPGQPQQWELEQQHDGDGQQGQSISQGNRADAVNSSQLGLLAKVQGWLEGSGGLYDLVLGLHPPQEDEQQQAITDGAPTDVALEQGPGPGMSQELQQGMSRELQQGVSQELQPGASQELQPPSTAGHVSNNEPMSRPLTGQSTVSRPLTGQSAVMEAGQEGVVPEGDASVRQARNVAAQLTCTSNSLCEHIHW